MTCSEHITQSAIDQHFAEWHELNATVIHCSANKEAAQAGFEAGWHAAFEHCLDHREIESAPTQATEANE